MKSKTGWIFAIVTSIILLLVLPGIFMMGRSWSGGYGGMMGGYSGMMGNFGYMNPFGFIGMALMWLIPLGFIVLIVFGAVSLINGLTKPGKSAPPAAGSTCSSCGKQTQSDWTNCPYCGSTLKWDNAMCGGKFVRMLIPLTSMPLEQAGRTPNGSTAPSQSTCSSCGSLITPAFAWCPKCGNSLRAHPCAYCGQTISSGVDFCRYCGASANKR